MATIDPVIVKLQADVSDLQKGLEKANGYLKGLDDQVKKADSAFAGMSTRLKQLGATIGITFGASQIVSFFKSSVAASLEAEASQARLRQLLLNTNGATEAQITALGKQAKALEQVGVVSADNITVAQSQLATFDLSAAAIGKLTPAILDYVTAEKGATASADDYKQMTNSLAQALQGNFASLTRVGFVLDEATKKQIANGTEMERSQALVEVLNSTYKDFNKNLRDTTEGGLQVAINEFNNLKQEIGDGLRPVVDNFAQLLVKTVIPALRSIINFVKNNQAEIKAFAIVIGIATTAWAAYIVQQKLATLTFKAFTEALKKNAFVLIVTALATVVAMLVKAYNNVQWFRDAVNATAKFALKAFASIVPILATVYEAIAKIVTGPMRLFLETLSKLPGVGKFAKSALDVINNGINNISEVGTKAAAKANELANKLDNMAKVAKKAGEETKKAGQEVLNFGKGKTTSGGSGLSDKDKKKLDDYKKKVQDIYKDINEIISESSEKAQEALERRNERMAEAEKRNKERLAELNERYQEQMDAAQERFDETKADLQARRKKAEEAATKKHAETILAINSEYRKRDIELQKVRDNKLADLELAAQRKREDIIAKGADKLRDIVEKSRQRLRDAWTKGTDFKLEDLFGTKDGGSLVDAIKKQLGATKALQKGAGDLAGAGFSQEFISQIVQAGPAAGMAMIDEIKKLSPQQQKEVQKMYAELTTINQTGMDSIAQTLSTSTNLATAELRQMYQETQNDIATALKEIDAELKTNIADAKTAYSEALAEAETIRKDKLAEADKDLKEALAASKTDYNEALDDAQKTLEKAQAEAKKTLDKGLQEAAKILHEALLDAQKDYEKAIDEINKSTQKKLDDLLAKLREVAAEMNKVQKGAGAGVVSGAPSYTPIVAQPITTKLGTVVDETGKTVPAPVRAVTGDGSLASFRAGEELSMAKLQITQNFTNVTADAWDIHEKTLSAIRYGTAITPKPSTPIPASLRARGRD